VSERRTSAVASVVVLCLLIVNLTPTVWAVTSQPGTPGWWNSAYQFRRPVTVTNGGSAPLVNQTVILRLNFTGVDVEDPLATVRLVSAGGAEIPSVIAGTEAQGFFIRSAYLLFTVDLPPQSSGTFYIYYGTAFNNVPSYRASGPAGNISNGFMAGSSVPLSLDSSQIQIGFGTVDTETTVTKVTYGSGVQGDFGPSVISAAPFANDTGLISAGQLGSGATVAYETLGAGALQLTRILILGPDGALTVDAVSNGGGTAVQDVSLTSVIGLGGLASLGTSSSTYVATSGLLYTQNPDADFLMQQSAPASSFSLGATAKVYSEALNSTFNGASTYTLASEAGFNWQLGSIQPSGAAWVSSSWSVTSSLENLTPSLALPIGAMLGGAETLDVATPNARVLWSATATLTNVAIPSSGLVVPFGIGNAELIPEASSFSGTYIYSVPPTGLQNPQAWSSLSSTTGNATVYSSPQYYDFESGKVVERVALHTPLQGTGSASLISAGAFALGGSSDVLKISYRASFSVSAGTLSSQYLFIAADLAPSGANNFTQTIYLPVTGSSASLSPGVCTPSGFPPSVPSTVIQTVSLVGDNTWRTTSVVLPSSLPNSGFDVRLRLCTSSSAGFSGDLNLELGAAGIVSRGPVARFLEGTWTSAPAEMSLGYLPQASEISPAGITANLTMNVLFQANSNVSWADGTTFAGEIAPPPDFRLTNSLDAVLGNPELQGVIVGSSVGGYAKSGSVNGNIGSISASQGTAFLRPEVSTTVQTPIPFSVGLGGVTFDVTVLDQASIGVPGTTVTVFSDGVAVPISVATNSMGIAQFVMVPSTYQFNATYQGTSVGSTTAQVGAQPSATIQADLYKVTILVLDSRGGKIPGAQIYLGVGNSTESGTTDSQGRYTFDGVANSIYPLTVGVGNASVFAGSIRASANDVLIEVTTTYVPSSTQLLVAALLGVSSVAIVVAFYFVSRMRRS
jgi:hypothetical protein